MAVYAVDFDGTLAVTRFPEIIGPRKKVVAAVKMLKASGHKIILWTSRDGKELEAAVEWCKAQGIVFDAVNAPLPEQIQRWGNDTRKIYADFYIDDKAMRVEELENIMDSVVDIVDNFVYKLVFGYFTGLFLWIKFSVIYGKTFFHKSNSIFF